LVPDPEPRTTNPGPRTPNRESALLRDAPEMVQRLPVPNQLGVGQPLNLS
jgi:hypothetical protein